MEEPILKTYCIPGFKNKMRFSNKCLLDNLKIDLQVQKLLIPGL